MFCLLKTIAQAGDGIPGRFIRVFAKAKCQDKSSVRFHQINFGGQSYIAVFRPRVFPGHPVVRLQILPAIRRTDIAGRALGPRRGTGQRQCVAVALRKQQGCALEFAHPGSVAATVIPQMRREQDVHVIIRQAALLCVKLNLLQHRIPVRVSHNLLFDAVTAITAGVDQPECRHAVGQPFHSVAGIALSPRRRNPLRP